MTCCFDAGESGCVLWCPVDIILMEEGKPETYRNFETALHDAYLQNLVYCSQVSEHKLDSPAFTFCMKAAGINFKHSYDDYQNYKKNALMMAIRGMTE